MEIGRNSNRIVKKSSNSNRCHRSLFSALEAEIILHEPWPLMAFLLPPEEIVCQGASATITVGVSIIVALAPWHTISSGGRRKAMSGQGSCKIISASKAEKKEQWHKSAAYKECSE